MGVTFRIFSAMINVSCCAMSAGPNVSAVQNGLASEGIDMVFSLGCACASSHSKENEHSKVHTVAWMEIGDLCRTFASNCCFKDADCLPRPKSWSFREHKNLGV